MEAHRIAIISDTHGLLRQEVIDALKTCEVILHGGDMGTAEVLEQLNDIAKTYAVRGNVDGDWAEELPNELILELFGFQIYLVHNKKHIRKELSGIDIIIYGHSHKYEEKYVDGRLFLNPGSCGPRRFTQPVTMAILEIADNASFQVKKIDIPHKTSGASGTDNPETEKIPQDIKQIINQVIKETNKGRTVKEISDKYGLNKELTEQICRLYLTHPGVDADGIMGKMGM